MSVVGIGTDILDITRLERMPIEQLIRLAKRVLTANEFDKYQTLTSPVPFLAKRWAAKEAASKALGTGIAQGVSFQHFEITSLASGQPVLSLFDVALSKAQALGASSWHISLSDEKTHTIAFVVLSK